MADVLPQLIERIENIERQANITPANSLTVASLTGSAPAPGTLENNPAPAIDASAAPATKLDLANATGTDVNAPGNTPAVRPDTTSQAGMPVADVTGDTGTSTSKSKK